MIIDQKRANKPGNNNAQSAKKAKGKQAEEIRPVTPEQRNKNGLFRRLADGFSGADPDLN